MLREPSSEVVQFAAHMKAQVTHQVILAGIPQMNSEPGEWYITAEGHAAMAVRLLPQVIAAIGHH